MKTEINDIQVYYEDQGQGEPVIFVHGWLDDSSVWKPYVEPFSGGHRVIVYDHRGHGQSDKPKGSYSIKTLANDLHALIQKLDLGKVTLVGHSMGAMTSMLFALDHPGRVTRLVLVGAAARLPSIMRGGSLIRHILPYRKFIEMAVKSAYHMPSEAVIQDSLKTALNTPKYAAYACYDEFTGKYDVRYRVAKIEVPTLIVVGEQDKNTPVAMSRFLSGEIKGSRLQVIAGCGHEVMVEKPEELKQALAEFLG
ncbi:MAG: alpha/beta hydrolase [Dehalococcoidales bacterium]|nr:MAG: alpha/beta hydrolase [Dehalococcoidales bacterium]